MATQTTPRPATAPSDAINAQIATDVLERDYKALRPEVLAAVGGKLRASGIELDHSDLDAAYNQAWHAIYLKLADGEQIESLTGLLVAITHRRSVDFFRSLNPGRMLDGAVLEAVGTSDDIDQLLDDRMQIRQFMEGLRDRLTNRELQAATLCYLYGLTRPEAAEAIGVRPKRMEKIMDGVSKKVGALTGAIQAGEWCESRKSLMSAYAMGLLEPDSERFNQAVDHLRECPACRREVALKRGLGAFALPVPAVLAFVGAGAGVAGAVGAGAGAVASGFDFGAKAVLGAVAATGAVAASAVAIAVSTGGDDKPAKVDPQPAQPAAAAPAPEPAAEKSKPEPKPKPKKSEPAPEPAPVVEAPPPAPVVEPAPEPEPPPIEDGAGEFDAE